MGHQINSYVALGIIATVAMGAAQLIIHFANQNAFAVALDAETNYLHSQSAVKK